MQIILVVLTTSVYLLLMPFHFFLKAYALTALMKIYAFEKAAGRKVDMLPEVMRLNSNFKLLA